MDPADLAVFFPFLFLELLNPNLWPAEGAGPTLNLPENGPRYPPRSNLDEAVPRLQILGINMSQNPDSMQSPEQVSDFDADAWFQPPRARSRRPRPRTRAAAENRTAGIFFSKFYYGGDLSYME